MNYNTRKIIMWKDEDEPKTYLSIKDCIKDNPDLLYAGIQQALHGAVKHYKGFHFMYADMNVKEQLLRKIQEWETMIEIAKKQLADIEYKLHNVE